MQFRRSGQRDDRRRRVFSDTTLDESESARRNRSSLVDDETQRPARNYGDGEFMDEQPRLTDMIPTNIGVIVLVFIVGLAIVVGLETLYFSMPRLAEMSTDGRVAALDLDGEGSLAVWFSSTVLLMSAFVAVVIYLVRRHRHDDFQGYYRIWLWAAMCWILMSVDETASLHEGFKEMMAHLTSTRIYGDGSLWWVIPYFFLLGAVGTRILIDMRECWIAASAMLATAACYALAVVTQLGWILHDGGARGVMLEEGAEMVGNLMLLFAMTLFARHVILDAYGMLPVREPRVRKRRRTSRKPERRPERKPEPETPLDEERPIRVHPPRRSRAKRPSRPAPLPDPVAHLTQFDDVDVEEDEDEIESSAPVQRKLTKAEKKALRNKLRKNQRERQRHAG